LQLPILVLALMILLFQMLHEIFDMFFILAHHIKRFVVYKLLLTDIASPVASTIISSSYLFQLRGVYPIIALGPAYFGVQPSSKKAP
jgi:hypothetical protein